MSTSRPFAIGLCTSEHPLQHQQYYSQQHSHHYHEDDSISLGATPPTPDTIPTHPFIAHVDYQASVTSLSAALDLPERHIISEILHDDQPVTSTSLTSSSFLSHRQMKKKYKTSVVMNPRVSANRFTPKSVIDTYLCLSNGSISSSSSSSSSSSIAKQNQQGQQKKELIPDIEKAISLCKSFNLDVSKYIPLFISPNSQACSIVRFANDLKRRLNSLLFIPTVSIENHETSNECGFDMSKCHRHIEISCNNLAVHKVRPGLYRTTCSTLPVMEPNRGMKCTSYFEMIVISMNTNKTNDIVNGLCIGIASRKLPSDRLIGSDDYSVGLHSNGSIVRSKGSFHSVDSDEKSKNIKFGDRIGCAVYTDGSSDIGITFFINNVLYTRVTLNTPSHHTTNELYAAVSLYEMDAKVVLLCCKHDWNMDLSKLSQMLCCNIDSICNMHT